MLVSPFKLGWWKNLIDFIAAYKTIEVVETEVVKATSEANAEWHQDINPLLKLYSHEDNEIDLRSARKVNRLSTLQAPP